MEEVEIMQGPLKLMDIFPWIIPYVPTIIKNKWMKLNCFEELRGEFVDFLKVCSLHAVNYMIQVTSFC